MNTYEKIREIRNKMFPPKLEFGCEVILYNNEYRETILREVPIPEEHIFDDEYKKEADYSYYELFQYKERISERQIKKILGKLVSLNEILLIIKNKKPKTQLDIIVNLLDLNLPIKAQKSEVLEKILKLIK